MIVGFDFWHVLSHWPRQISHLIEIHERAGDEVHIVSAVGAERSGTVLDQVREITRTPSVHEVLFENDSDAPALKLARCRELGIELFYDDRQDVCDLLVANGILAFIVPVMADQAGGS